MPQDITPLRQQYLDIKKQYPDAILFFRLGDFYETFDDDARKASAALDIVLTSRPVAKGVRVPMAGIPFHAADNYLGRLIEKVTGLPLRSRWAISRTKACSPARLSG
jgi:DNA mismatch repair protein MutS